MSGNIDRKAERTASVLPSCSNRSRRRYAKLFPVTDINFRPRSTAATLDLTSPKRRLSHRVIYVQSIRARAGQPLHQVGTVRTVPLCRHTLAHDESRDEFR
jgi:hypothetical protein